MYRVHLTEEQREELKRRTRDAEIKPRTRDRLELIRLLDAGWSIPRASKHLRMSPRRARHWVRRYLEGGFDALPDQPHLGRTSQLTPRLLELVREELAKGGRTWTARQIAAWLEAEHEVRLSRDHLGSLLRRAKLSPRRTELDLGHKQDPAEVAERTADLQTLEKGATPGAWMSAT